MRNLLKRKSICVLLVLAILLGFTCSVMAEPLVRPAGPFLNPNANVGRQSILTTVEVEEQLYSLERRSRGAMEVKLLGYSGADDQPLLAAVIGEGPKRIWIQGRIHGNEPYGAEASLDILRTLVAGGRKARDVLEEVTFMIIPNYNPDGFDRYIRQEGLHGIDLNRDWNISYETWLLTRELVPDYGFRSFDWDWFTRFRAVESQTFFEAWMDFKPHYAIDIHHWGTPTVEGTNEMTTFGIGIPVNPAHLRPEIWDAARQMAVAAYDATNKLGYCNPTQYMYIDLPSACVSAMAVGGPGPGYPGPTWEAEYLECVRALEREEECKTHGEDCSYECLTEIPVPTQYHADEDGFILDPEWDTAAMFFETRGGIQQISRGYLINQNIVALWAIIDAVAFDTLGDVDPDRWDDMPGTGPAVGPWHKWPQLYDY